MQIMNRVFMIKLRKQISKYSNFKPTVFFAYIISKTADSIDLSKE